MNYTIDELREIVKLLDDIQVLLRGSDALPDEVKKGILSLSLSVKLALFSYESIAKLENAIANEKENLNQRLKGLEVNCQMAGDPEKFMNLLKQVKEQLTVQEEQN